MSSGAGRANCIDDRIILVGKNRAQIELETFIPEVANDGWNRPAKPAREILHRAIRWENVDRDRRHHRSRQRAAANFRYAPANGDLERQAAQASEHGRGPGPQLVFRNLQKAESGDV